MTDVIAFTYSEEMPKWNPINICSYPSAGGGRDAGPGARLRAGQRDRRPGRGQGGRPGAARCGLPQSRRAHLLLRQRGLRFVTEMCKMRAFTALWDEICADPLRGRRREAPALPLRGPGQFARPDRAAAGEQRLPHPLWRCSPSCSPRTPGPGPCSCRPGTRRSACPGPGTSSGRLRLQQILAYETDLLEYRRPLHRRDRWSRPEVEALIAEAQGGAGPHRGPGRRRGRRSRDAYMKERLVESERGLRVASESRTGQQTVVGVNKPGPGDRSPRRLTAGAERRRLPRRSTRQAGAEAQVAALLDGLARRAATNPADVKVGPGAISEAAASRGRATSWSPRSPAAHAGVTTGEWGELRYATIYGEFRAPTGIGAGAASGSRRARSEQPWRLYAAQVEASFGPEIGRPAQDAGRQAWPGRPLQRRRADRGQGPRRRHGSGL